MGMRRTVNNLRTPPAQKTKDTGGEMFQQQRFSAPKKAALRLYGNKREITLMRNTEDGRVTRFKWTRTPRNKRLISTTPHNNFSNKMGAVFLYLIIQLA
jgi:hypothetical protein